LLCPLDTIKTRLQFQGKFNVKHYSGPLDALMTISREEGLGAFTRGLPARVVYQMPAAAVSFFFYEKIVKGIRMPNVRRICSRQNSNKMMSDSIFLHSI
jgi:solute carrier family 25 (mitochondrial aspartate/glutamate transporter), member 12/13